MVDTDELVVSTFGLLKVTDAVVCVPVIPTNRIPFSMTTILRASTTNSIRNSIAFLPVATRMETAVIW